ncbi:type VI secretion system baseplate subunit TssE [Corallincola platygyrae]|uniref:Type VI secretion system baseplate subunit TssE n=1 Tax=Corallincola platygyrae TaxID=1193278 RepID=A0ABW4XMG2_9GAMM
MSLSAKDRSQAIQPSIIDRLVLDQDSSTNGGQVQIANVSLYRDSIRRDLENLLNARQTWIQIPEAYEELKKSVLSYGLPDFATLRTDSEDGQSQVCSYIEQLIRTFDLRFTHVSVYSLSDPNSIERTFKIRINAVVQAEPLPEEITFDSELEPVRLGISVRKVG